MYNQLSVEKAIASNAVATIAEIVANDNVTAEQGIVELKHTIMIKKEEGKNSVQKKNQSRQKPMEMKNILKTAHISVRTAKLK